MTSSKIQFCNENVKKSFEKLDDFELKKFLERAFEDIEKNVFCGIQIPKKLIPKEYVQKYKIKNLWKYNLPDAWRLIYSVESDKICVLSIILEWMDHKEYERRFKY